MNISIVIARKGNKFESLAISEDAREIKDGFKQVDESFGFDAVYLIDSRSGTVRAKKFNREVAPVKEKKSKVKAPAPEQTPEQTEGGTSNEGAPDFLQGLD